MSSRLLGWLGCRRSLVGVQEYENTKEGPSRGRERIELLPCLFAVALLKVGSLSLLVGMSISVRRERVCVRLPPTTTHLMACMIERVSE